MKTISKRILNLLIIITSIAINPLFSEQNQGLDNPTETENSSNINETSVSQEIINDQETLDLNCAILASSKNLCEYLALKINNSSVPKISILDKEKITSILKEITTIIGSLLRDRAMLASVQDHSILLRVNYAFSNIAQAVPDHIYKLVSSQFTTIEPFDIQTLTKKNLPENLSLSEIKSVLESTQKKIAIVREKIDTADLVWYNKWARKIDETIVIPAQKYHIPQIAKMTLLTSAAITLGLWELGSEYTHIQWKQYLLEHSTEIAISSHLFEADAEIEINKIVAEQNDPDFGLKERESLIKNKAHLLAINKAFDDFSETLNPLFSTMYGLIGFPYKRDRGYIDTAEMTLNPSLYSGKISALDNGINSYLSNHVPLLTMVGGYLFTQYSTWWNGSKDSEHKQSGMREKIKQKIQMGWNFLRGGAHLNQKVEGMWDFQPSITFDDVVGLDEAKMVLSSVLEFIDKPEMFMNIKLTPELGYILTGKTRTGKTYIFEALCGEILRRLSASGRQHEFKFKILPAEHIIRYGIRAILEWAKEEAPMVLFIDEIDLLNLQRVGNSTLLSEFLTALGSAFNKDPKKPVIIIAATNKPETLDFALRQPGRLGREIRFERPSLEHRKEYLVREFHNMAVDISMLDLDTLAEKTYGASFEDLHTIVAAALRISWMYGQMLSQELLEQCIDSELRHIMQVDNRALSKEETAILTSHFAGRAIAGLLLELPATLDTVTIKSVMADLEEEAMFAAYANKKHIQQQKIVFGGIFMKQSHDSINFRTYEQSINEIKLLLAGFAAEELLLGNCAYSCHQQDRDKAYQEARKLIFGGLKPESLAKDQERELSSQAYALMTQCGKEVKALLSEHIDALNAIAQTLTEYKTLRENHVKFIMDVAEGRIDLAKLQEEMKNTVQQNHPEEIAESVVTA